VTRTEAYIALNMVAHLGPVRLRKLLDRFHEPQRILRANRAELQAVEGLPVPAIEAILSWESENDLSSELRRISEYRATILTQEDHLYPRLLREIYDPPIVLYIWGEVLG
jgi:DNA processing protein